MRKKPTKVGRFVKKLRQEKKYSLEQLARICSEASGIPIQKTTIYKIESGETQRIQLPTLTSLAAGLKIPPAILISGGEVEPAEKSLDDELEEVLYRHGYELGEREDAKRFLRFLRQDNQRK